MRNMSVLLICSLAAVPQLASAGEKAVLHTPLAQPFQNPVQKPHHEEVVCAPSAESSGVELYRSSTQHGVRVSLQPVAMTFSSCPGAVIK